MLLCPMGTRKMGLGVSSPRAQQPKTGLQTATQSVINCSGCEMAGLAGMLRQAHCKLAASSSCSVEEPMGKGSRAGPHGSAGMPGKRRRGRD